MSEPSDEATATRIAHILGDNCSAALALKEVEKRRKAGLAAGIALIGRHWIVFPQLPTPESTTKV